ncbi:MAG: hypothetical protein HZB18_06910 [Chloroflexi bacterium]|nr:hypothetical protein [Chloroflexota bacterium]
MDESARLKNDFQFQAEFEARWGWKREWGRCGKGAGRVMAVVIFQSKVTFVSGGISFSPLGEKGEGFSCFALQSRHASQKHHPRSNWHQRKASTRPRTAA